MYLYKSSDGDHADVVLDIYPEQNLKSWTHSGVGWMWVFDLNHMEMTALLLSETTVNRIKGALLISRYTAGQD